MWPRPPFPHPSLREPPSLTREGAGREGGGFGGLSHRASVSLVGLTRLGRLFRRVGLRRALLRPCAP
ncbi:hypothetical protein E2C01_058013 [Portunus trituberculatus]|uniref:Uncharacterized protein n=1 Tax=Portunus trituberculatus TaxID=210409 RepID=A0A5B7H2M3_PORTR|nr:hypothetical protein [Portunus trituberculatus]